VYVLSKYRIWLCVALSVAMHVVVLTELPGLVGLHDPPVTPITAQLVAVEPTPPEPPAVKAHPTPPPRRVPPAPAAPPRPAPPPLEGPTVLPPAATEPPEPAAEPPQTEQATEPVAQPEAPALLVPEPTPPVASPVVAPTNAQARPVRDLPAHGSIRYELFIGADRISIGRTMQTWVFEDTTYRLTSFSETTGLIGFFRPYQLGYVSEGRLDAAGLLPESFTVRRGRTGARQFAARFDWAGREITLGPVDAPRKTPLPAGTLDTISFIYQLARAELTPGQIRLNITNGSKIDMYTLEVGDEEPLELPVGAMRTIPVRQVRIPGQESLEIWFAPDRGFLPVRIRTLDREGKMSGELVANEIAIDGR